MKHWLAVTIAGVIIILSTVLQGARLWTHGLRVSADSLQYLSMAHNLYQHNTLTYRYYNPPLDEVVTILVAHYPPLTAIMFSLPLWVGVPLEMAPTVVALVVWPLFLVGLAWATYQLSDAPHLMVYAVVIGAISSSFLIVSSHALSELIFVPLLVWILVIFANLPQQTEGFRGRLVLGITLLCLLMLTRYVGMFFYGGVVLWWTAWRIQQRRIHQLPREWLLFGIAGLVFLVYLIRNMRVSGGIFGGYHLTETISTFLDGVRGVAAEIAASIFPPLRSVVYWLFDGLATMPAGVGYAFVGVMFGAVGYLLWRYRVSLFFNIPVWQSPIVVLLTIYLGLYIAVQPFALFTPMDTRDYATAFCLIVPWALAALTTIPQRWQHTILVSYVGLNVAALTLAPWVTFNPLTVRAPAESAGVYFNTLHLPNLVPHFPPRTRDLLRHHPDVVAFLQALESDQPAVISSAEPFLAAHPELATPAGAAPTGGTLVYWVENGACHASVEAVIVVFDWVRWDINRWSGVLEEPGWEELLGGVAARGGPVELIEAKCPHLEKTVLTHSIIYQLPVGQ